MTTVITRGAGSAQALGYAARATAANYIEDVFSTYLYTGNRPTGQTITNGIDLSTKGGLVWLKDRTAANSHGLFDSARGISNGLYSNSTSAQFSYASGITSFNTTGFTLGSDTGGFINVSGNSYASWTFRKQAKFFDVVTYTGTGANRTIAHNLGSVPGMIIVKRTDTTGDWQCYHRSLANTQYMVLNTTAAVATGATRWNSTTPTDTVFSLGTDATVNASGGNYVAYLFAHNAGGFGASGADNVISCGSFVADNYTNGPEINLGWEPQWLLVKNATNAVGWITIDNMRRFTADGSDATLAPNSTAAEVAQTGYYKVLPTGFVGGTAGSGGSTNTFIYIAIRRGPMRTPTSGTSVFSPVARTGTGADATITSNFAPDAVWSKTRAIAQDDGTFDKLRGAFNLRKSSTGAEYTATNSVTAYTNTGVTVGLDTDTGAINSPSTTYVNYLFRRAPGFFDEVCYTGTGANRTVSHNLGVAPELMIVKGRSGATAWQTYSSALANTEYLVLNTTAAKATGATRWNSTTPTSSVFSLGTASEVNTSAATYVAYLFATVAGVSKVGTYTGNGSSQTINCGFTGGSRFVLIKRYDSTGNWTVFDSARGIVAGNDPALYLNSTAAEVTTIDAVDTDNSGFIVNQETTLNLNVNAASYVFFAIA